MVSYEGALDCLSCSNGSVALSGGSACSCPNGEMWDWDENRNGSCNPCQPGTFNNDPMASCQVCPLDSTSYTGSDRCICPAGTFWNNTQCDGCPKGSVSPPGALNCLICPPDSSPDTNKTICLCPFGKSWSWDDGGVGTCNLVSLSLITGLVLICVLGVLGLVSLTLGIVLAVVLLSQKQRRVKDVRSTTNVAYVVQGDVEISCNQQSGMSFSGEENKAYVAEDGVEISCHRLSGSGMSFSGVINAAYTAGDDENIPSPEHQITGQEDCCVSESSFSGASDNIYNTPSKK